MVCATLTVRNPRTNPRCISSVVIFCPAHAYCLLLKNKNFSCSEEITQPVTISTKRIRPDNVCVPPHTLTDLDLIEQCVTYPEYICCQSLRFVIPITRADTFPYPVDVNDKIVLVAYVMYPRTLTGTRRTVDKIDLLTESIEPAVYLVVTAEVDEHDIVRIETDVVIVDVLLVQFDLMMTDAVILPCDRFATALAYDLPVVIQPVEL